MCNIDKYVYKYFKLENNQKNNLTNRNNPNEQKKQKDKNS